MSRPAFTSQTSNINDQNEHDATPKLSHDGEPLSPASKSKTALNEYKSFFVTSATLSSRGIDERKTKFDEIIVNYKKLNDYILKLDDKVKQRLGDNEIAFFKAYQEQMTHIKKELDELKKKTDEETIRRKNDERFNKLQLEKEFFQFEANRLNKLCEEQQKTIQELRNKLKVVSEDKEYFKEFVLAAKKENKELKEELIQLELGNKNFEEHFQSPPPTRGGSSSQRRNISQSAKRSLNASSSMKELPVAPQPELFDQEKFLEIVKQLKEALDKERRNSKQLRHEKTQLIAQRLEMEEILVDCINEVKKEIYRRRNIKVIKDVDKGPVVPQEIDISKFSATDKRNLIEYFMSNDKVLDQLYHMVFSVPSLQNMHVLHEADKSQNELVPSLTRSGSVKLEGKPRHSLYGLGNNSSLLKVSRPDINNLLLIQKPQNIVVGMRKSDGIKIEVRKKEL